jgi:putative acetyltransferase
LEKGEGLMNVRIRSEKISDYTQISNVNYEAFLGWHPDNQFVSEPLIIDLLRHNSMFDSELSLVAEFEGDIMGHAIFSPFKFVVLGEEQRGVVLGPIAVNPVYQQKGIGKLLIEEGRRRAQGESTGRYASGSISRSNKCANTECR